MFQKVDFDRSTYQQRARMPISHDAEIAVSRARDSLILLMRLEGRRTGGYSRPIKEIKSEHLLVGLCEDPKSSVYLRELGFTAETVIGAIQENDPYAYDSDTQFMSGFQGISENADKTLLRAADEARQLKATEVVSGHILLATCYDPRPRFEQIVGSFGVGVEKIRKHVMARMTGQPSPYIEHAEYIAKHKVGKIPPSIEYIAAYLRDETADPKLRADLVKGMDEIVKRIGQVDPRG